MGFTKNCNDPEMPTGPVEWGAIFNTLIANREAGRTIKITAAEALSAGQPVQPPRVSDSKVEKADNTDNFLGIVKEGIAQDAEGFVYAGVGNEITNGSWSWTVGGLIYVGTTPGTLTQAAPTSDAIAIGYANSATSIVLLRPVLSRTNSHASTHENSGADEISVAGLSGLLADFQKANNIESGADASKAASPAVGDIYLATDTDKVYKCISAGSWSLMKNLDLSGNLVADLSDITSAGADIEDAVTKKHSQNPVSHHFMQSDVAASQSAVAIPVLGLAGNAEIVMAKLGSAIGISIASNAARTAGTLTVDVTVNGTAIGLQAVLDGTNTQYHYATQAGGLDTFVAGDRLGVKITTDGTWAPTTADIVVMVLAEV